MNFILVETKTHHRYVFGAYPTEDVALSLEINDPSELRRTSFVADNFAKAQELYPCPCRANLKQEAD